MKKPDCEKSCWREGWSPTKSNVRLDMYYGDRIIMELMGPVKTEGWSKAS